MEAKVKAATEAAAGNNDKAAVRTAIMEALHELCGTLETCSDDASSVGSEYEDSLSNMPEGLQSGPTGELIPDPFLNRVELTQLVAGSHL